MAERQVVRSTTSAARADRCSGSTIRFIRALHQAPADDRKRGRVIIRGTMFFPLPRTATAPFCPAEVKGSVSIRRDAPLWLRIARTAGPGLLVSVGYMDPGNWATDIEAGSRYGYALLWVVLASSLAAMLLQTLSLRLGLVTGMDL